MMEKTNKLRRVYLIYLISIGELICAALIICAGYVPVSAWQTIMRVIGIFGAAAVPVIVYIFYRWLRKDNDTASDELEQLVLTRALAATGLVSASLAPFLLLLVSLLSTYAGYILFVYTVVVWGTLKLATFYYYKKY